MLHNRPILVALVRHGHTLYTGKPPDITPQGALELAQTAPKVVEFAEGLPPLFLSSPQPRAIGSCQTLAQAMSSPIEQPTLISALDQVKLRDRKTARAIINIRSSPVNYHTISRAYWNESIFDNPQIFESKKLIKARLFRLLSQLAERGDKSFCYVAVSHFEVLAHLVHVAFGWDFKNLNQIPIKFAEPIFLALHQTSKEAMASVVFRNNAQQINLTCE